MENNKLVINIGPNRKLVAEIGTDTQYKEIFVNVTDAKGREVKGLVVVRPSYTYDDDGKVQTTRGSYDVLLKDHKNQTYDSPIVYKEKEIDKSVIREKLEKIDSLLEEARSVKEEIINEAGDKIGDEIFDAFDSLFDGEYSVDDVMNTLEEEDE